MHVRSMQHQVNLMEHGGVNIFNKIYSFPTAQDIHNPYNHT